MLRFSFLLLIFWTPVQAQDASDIYRRSPAPARLRAQIQETSEFPSLRKTSVESQRALDRGARIAEKRGVPVYVWVNTDPEDYPELAKRLEDGVNVVVSEVWGDSTPRVGTGWQGDGVDFRFVLATKIARNCDEIHAFFNDRKVEQKRPREVAVASTFPVASNPTPRKSSGSGAPAFNPTHSCPSCGTSQYVIERFLPDGSHVHRCPNCNTAWRH